MLGFGPKGFRDALMSPVRFHRVLRRGREYGPGLPPYEADEPAPPHDPERGLHFVCLNANISRQFEFLQNAWMNSSKFLPQFITLRGGAYFFLPSLRALRFFAEVGPAP
jgi:deferrochelatase/peroxidase EfeB